MQKHWKIDYTVHSIHNTTSSHERLFAGQQSSLTVKSLYTNSLGIHHCSINSLLYLKTIQDRYVTLYRELITQLQIYASAIRILAKDYLPNTLVIPSKLQDILKNVKTALQATNPEYHLVIDRLYLYYNMQLVTFGIDRDTNLIIQFPVFVQPYTQKPLILYQLKQYLFQLLIKMHKHIYIHNFKLRNHTLHWTQRLISPYDNRN